MFRWLCSHSELAIFPYQPTYHSLIFDKSTFEIQSSRGTERRFGAAIEKIKGASIGGDSMGGDRVVGRKSNLVI